MKKVIIKNAQSIDPVISSEVIGVIKDGGIVAFPSDTVYGLMARVSPESIQIIDRLKGRLAGKNYALMLDSLESLEKLMAITPDNLQIIKKNSPGYFTFVVRPEKLFDETLKILISKEGTVGIRIPSSEFMREVASKELILATSANKSGQPAVYSYNELRKQLGSNVDKIDLILDCDISEKNLASTVIALAVSPPTILRQGSGQLR